MPEIALDIQRVRAEIELQKLNQSELVARSGLSRAQIGRILLQRQPMVREKTLQSFAKALGVSASTLSIGGGLDWFRKWVASEFGVVDFRGIGLPAYPRQSIGAIFVEPDVIPDKATYSDDCGFVDGPTLGGASPPVPVSEAVVSHDRIVLIGQPGCGKTTVLKWLAYTHSCSSGKELPLYVRLPQFSRAQEIDSRIDLLKFILATVAENRCPGFERSLHDELADDRRQCLVLFDGLDEVGDEEHRELLVNSVHQFIERFPQNHFVVTSRAVGFDPLPWTIQNFNVMRILNYSVKRQEEFAGKWAKILAHVHHRPEAGVIGRINEAVFSNPAIRNLAANPLILTILVLLNESRGGALPRRRVDLYAKIVDVFLETWEASKRSNDTFDETFGIELDSRELKWLLSDLSLAMQKTGRTLAPRWWIADRMRDYLQGKMGFAPEEARDASERIIRFLGERTGLIQESGLDVFGFSHRTLQEYFASLGAIDDADASSSRSIVECLRSYFFNPHWCEVMRLVAAQLTPPIAESLLTRIADDPDPIGRFLKRGTFLALRCLSDGATVPNRRFVSDTFGSVVELGKSKWLGITLEAFDILESFDGTRMEQFAKDAIQSILGTAEKNLGPEEYGCLYESVHFSSILEQANAQLPSNFQSEAAHEVFVTLDDRKCRIVYFNAELRSRNPAGWYRSIGTLLQEEGRSVEFREALVRELGRQIVTDPRSRRILRKILESAPSVTLRVACLQALGSVARKRNDAKLLLRILEHERNAEVRARSANALRHIAVSDLAVRERLVRILEKERSAVVRVGAARGLSDAAIKDQSITNLLLRFAKAKECPEQLRVACAWALEPQIGKSQKVTDAFKSWLDSEESPKLQRTAVQAVADAFGEDLMTWDYHLVERIEHSLMSLEKPCSHALLALEALASARELRRGLRMENVLRDVIKPLGNRVELAFVFGSTARDRQSQDSDIDLMIIGDAKLKDLSTSLRTAEKTLGRRISPVIYNRLSFKKKYQSGDPFLLDACRREKIPLLGNCDDVTYEELDDELRTMVAERLASP